MLGRDEDFGSPSAHDGSTLRINDMRLLHHWMTKGAKSLHPENFRKFEMWQGTVIELSFDHPFLLHGILGMSALHKAGGVDEKGRAALAAEADYHFGIALSIYKKKLENPDLEDALPLFLLSSILVNYSFGSANLEEPEHPLDAVEHCFRLLHGTRVVVRPHWEHLKETEIFSFMARPAMNPLTEPGPYDEEVWEVTRLKELTVTLEPARREAYIAAIDELQRAFIRTRKCDKHDDNEHSVMVRPFFSICSFRC